MRGEIERGVSRRQVERESLAGRGRTAECDDLVVDVHDGALCADGAAHDVVGVVHVDNDDLLCAVDLLAHTDEPVRLERERRKPDRAGLDAERRELYR